MYRTRHLDHCSLQLQFKSWLYLLIWFTNLVFKPHPVAHLALCSGIAPGSSWGPYGMLEIMHSQCPPCCALAPAPIRSAPGLSVRRPAWCQHCDLITALSFHAAPEGADCDRPSSCVRKEAGKELPGIVHCWQEEEVGHSLTHQFAVLL